jgi:hypothetical protein
MSALHHSYDLTKCILDLLHHTGSTDFKRINRLAAALSGGTLVDDPSSAGGSHGFEK